MGGLFGGGNKETPVAQPTTLAAPPPVSADDAKGQGKAQADALKRAQTASTGTLATEAKDDGTYSSKTLG